ncbi:MAG: hypothetical protein ACRDF4_07355, partial [Rhabdochlamydiaceae bacterium]
VFYPSLLISATQGGSVTYSYGTTSGSLAQGKSSIIYVPSGTRITLSAHASAYLSSFRGWSGNGVGGGNESVSVDINSPANVQAAFRYNYVSIGALIVVAIIVLIWSAVLIRRKRTTYQLDI